MSVPSILKRKPKPAATPRFTETRDAASAFVTDAETGKVYGFALIANVPAGYFADTLERYPSSVDLLTPEDER